MVTDNFAIKREIIFSGYLESPRYAAVASLTDASIGVGIGIGIGIATFLFATCCKKKCLDSRPEGATFSKRSLVKSIEPFSETSKFLRVFF